jgi:glycosyltransferase involved in cell wall biosynthesis
MSVYNGARYLREAVESILAQEGVDFEFIIVDDGSTDESPAILDEYSSRDACVRVIHQENTGLTRALIRGCSEARGEFIARQDADDVSLPGRMATQIQMLEMDQSLGFVSCLSQYVGPADEPLDVVVRRPDPFEATRQLLDDRLGPPAHGTVIFRRGLYEQVGGYRKAFYFAQDADLWMRMAEISLIQYCPRILYVYRRHVNSISGSNYCTQQRFGELGQACRDARRNGRSEASFLAEAEILTMQIQEAKRAGRFRPDGEAESQYLIGSQLACNGDPRAAQYLWQVLRRRPWHLKAWVRLVQSQMGQRCKTAERTTDE